MATKPKILPIILNLSTYFFILFPCYYSTDTILQGQQLRDWEQLSSPNKLFRLQFFSPGTTKNRYLGIFYNLPKNPDFLLSPKDEQAVWVANRNTPIQNASGSLVIDSDGKLKILFNGGNRSVVFNTVAAISNASATLLDSGNFVLRELNTNGTVKRVLWESFDYPTDTLLPGMKLGINFKTGHVWSLTSWISDVSPASGSFTWGGDPNGTSQQIIWWRGNVSWTSGLWSKGLFSNTPELSSEKGHVFRYVSNENEKYFTYTVNDNRYINVPPKYMMYPDGYIGQTSEMAPFGNCFPMLVTETDPGCIRDEWPECRKRDYWFFIRRQGIIYGNGLRFDDSLNMSLFDCEAKCRGNCSCIAYAATDRDNKTGCKIWGRGMRFQATNNSLDHAFILVVDKEAQSWWIWLIIGLGAFLGFLSCCSCYRARRRLRVKGEAQKLLWYELVGIDHTKDEKMSGEFHPFSFESIAAATNNFSNTNKLGQGGFGPVYKGILFDGQEVAIKRLSRSSGQGLVEFKNEIRLIAKLQHTNLVRLLGCCIQEEEKILVYEYLPNKSLDFFLFDPNKKKLLKWKKRFNIIEGIAQGLLYLHKYSRLRVIHRDLKAGNILLDDNFNPKISDFGMARIFGLNESEANTNRVVGTYGYMSPEYAMNGIVSMKTDVFSFGVLLLEIVSSKKNNSSYNLEHPLNLVGLAWELWKEGRALELMYPDDSCPRTLVLRCIHVGLLCAQDHATDRPSMSDVVSMLTNETMKLPPPKQPAFFIEMGSADTATDGTSGNCSANTLTISVMEAR